MTVHFQFVVRLILIISLIKTSLPAPSVCAPPSPTRLRTDVEQQALMPPPFSDLHDAARRGSAVSLNTVKLFHEFVTTPRSVTTHSKNTLELFAQRGDASAWALYTLYQKTRVSFFILLGLRTMASAVFICLISFRESNGNTPGFLELYVGIRMIDQLFNILLAKRRDIFGKIFYDLFPIQLKIDVERMRFGHESNTDASSVFDDPVRTAKLFAAGQLLRIYSWESILGIAATALGLSFVHYGLAVGYFAFMLLFLGVLIRLSSKTSLIKTLGHEKDRALNQWMQETVLLTKMGFSQGAVRPAVASASSAIDRLIDEKMKYVTWLRAIAVIFPSIGAFAQLPLSTLAIFQGIESFFFLPDWAKEMAESKPAERSIRSFLIAHPKPPVTESPLRIAMIDRLELNGFSLSVPDSSPGGQGRQRNLIRNVNVDLPTGTLQQLWAVNGSGKTTLLRYLAGLNPYATTSGQAHLLGRTGNGEAVALDVRQAGAYVHYFSPSPLSDRMTMRAFMAMLETDDEKYLFRSWIETADILRLDFDRTDISGLSRGQKDRLQLAFTLAKTKASIILVDEALAHMDEGSQQIWLRLMKDYAERYGKLIILAEKAAVVSTDLLDGLFHLRNDSAPLSGHTNLIRIHHLSVGENINAHALGRAA